MNSFTAVFSSDDATTLDIGTHDFTIRLEPAMRLNGRYAVSLCDLSLWYTWHNISDLYSNTAFKYWNGVVWKTVYITKGIYDAADLANAISDLLTAAGDNPANLIIEANQNSQKFLITLSAGYQIDFTGLQIRILFGADNAILTTSGLMPNVAQMTNGVNTWILNSDLVDYGISGSHGGKALHSFSPQVSPGSHIREIPNKYYVMVKNTPFVESVRFWLTDQRGRPLSIQNEPVSIRLHFSPVA